MANNKLFVIFGTQNRKRGQLNSRPVKGRNSEPNVDVLKRSPCLDCELYLQEAMCPHVSRCSKIDEFQTVAAAHCTLFKDQDVFSTLKI